MDAGLPFPLPSVWCNTFLWVRGFVARYLCVIEPRGAWEFWQCCEVFGEGTCILLYIQEMLFTLIYFVESPKTSSQKRQYWEREFVCAAGVCVRRLCGSCVVQFRRWRKTFAWMARAREEVMLLWSAVRVD